MKDKSYIKQRLKYVAPEDYIIELENKIDVLEEENKRLITESTEWENRTYCWQDRAENLEISIDKVIKFIEEKISSTKGVLNDYMYHKEHNKILIELLQEDIEMYKKELNILNGDSNE